MKLHQLFAENVAAHLQTVMAMAALTDHVDRAGQLAADCLAAGGKLLLCGNGGSASDAQHFAGELMGRFLAHREPYAAVALTADSSVLTCVANDYGYGDIFSRQVAGLGRAGDLLVAISTSGESESVLRAARQARQGGLRVLGLTGRGGGRLAAECDIAIVVPSPNTARIQEAHILVIHTLCELIEHRLRQDGRASP